MSINKNCFYGEIEGKRINDFTRELDYSIDTVQGRIDFVSKKIDHPFFYELFTQTFDSKVDKEGLFWCEEDETFMSYNELKKWCKTNSLDIDEYLSIENPFQDIVGDSYEGDWVYSNTNTSNIKLIISTSDNLYSESNIAKELSKLADYILAKDTKKKGKVEYKFYTDEDLFKKKIKEQALVNKISQETNKENEVVHYLKRKGQNFKKEKKQVITSKDIAHNKILKEYQTSLDEYRKFISNVYSHEQDKKNNSLTITSKEYNRLQRYKYLCKKNIALTKEDMLYVKDSLNGTIYFKNTMPDCGTPDWDMIDFFDKNHIKALLLIGKKDITTELGVITHDLENILSRISLKPREKIALEQWRCGQTLEIIGLKLGVSNQAVDKMINMICKKIIKEYEIEYSKYYYFNIVKSNYQICSSCGESLPAIGLFFHFDVTNNRYRSRCKKCINTSYKLKNKKQKSKQ